MAEFTMQAQQENEWCWAAVAVSLHEFLNPASAATWSQATLATPVLTLERAIASGVNCAETPDVCNLPARLDDALSILGNLGAAGFLQGEHLTFESLQEWIDDQLPVCARIVWFSGGAHFIALDGYRVLSSGQQQVHVEDPLYGPSLQNYDDLVSDYPPGGSWQDTYLVQT